MSSQGDEIDWEHVAWADALLLRVPILELLAMDGGRTMSPKELAYELQKPPGSPP